MVTIRKWQQGVARTGRHLSYSPGTRARTVFFQALLVAGVGAGLAGCGTLAPGLDSTVTGSIAPAPVAVAPGEKVPAGVTPGDWIAARRALAEALAARDSAPSVPWENADTATRGTVTPLALADTDGASKSAGKCRAFLMSFVRDSDENWLQGEACRSGHSWQVDQARMLERS